MEVFAEGFQPRELQFAIVEQNPTLLNITLFANEDTKRIELTKNSLESTFLTDEELKDKLGKDKRNCFNSKLSLLTWKLKYSLFFICFRLAWIWRWWAKKRYWRRWGRRRRWQDFRNYSKSFGQNSKRYQDKCRLVFRQHSSDRLIGYANYNIYFC